jgi:hypothetical protein
MKLIDIERHDRSLQKLLALAQREDVVLARQGRILARVQKFTAEDLDDALFEHDPRVIRQGDAARRRFQRGEGQTLAHVRAELGLTRTGKKRRKARS